MICLRTSLFVAMMLIVVPFVRAQTAGGDSTPPILTLDEALRIASKNNRDIQVSRSNVTKAQEGVAEARTYYLPQLKTFVMAGAPLQPLNFTIPAGSLGTYSSTGPLPAKNATISSPEKMNGIFYASAAQPLTQLYKVHLEVEQTRLTTTLAREQLRGQQQQTELQVKDAYYQLAQMQPQVESAKAAVQYLTELSGLTERRLNVQTVLSSDVLTVKARLKQADYELMTLQDSIEIQKQNLNLLLGRDLTTQFSVEDEPMPDDAEMDLQVAQRQALEQRPDVSEARLETKVAQLDVRQERANYIPNISLQVNYLSFQNISFLPKNAGSVGLQLQWQPWDWGFKRHKIAELNAGTQQKIDTEQQTGQQVLVDVDNSFRKLKESRLLLEARADARDADREKLRETTNRYKQQTALLSDLLQQQSALSQADAQYQQALQEFWTDRADFEKAIGAP